MLEELKQKLEEGREAFKGGVAMQTKYELEKLLQEGKLCIFIARNYPDMGVRVMILKKNGVFDITKKVADLLGRKLHDGLLLCNGINDLVVNIGYHVFNKPFAFLKRYHLIYY